MPEPETDLTFMRGCVIMHPSVFEIAMDSSPCALPEAVGVNRNDAGGSVSNPGLSWTCLGGLPVAPVV